MGLPSTRTAIATFRHRKAGGAGFVGAFAVLELVDNGHAVVAYDRLAEPNDVLDVAGDRVALLQGNVLDRAGLAAVVRRHQIDGIVRTAAVIGQTQGASNPD